MTKRLYRTFLLAFLSGSLSALAAGDGNQLTLSTDSTGHRGATDAKGNVVLPFRFDYLEPIDSGYFLAGLQLKKDSDLMFGVVDAEGREIVPLRYAAIEYLRDFKRFKVTIESPRSRRTFLHGYLDIDGKVVVPVIYDRLDRISNMGSEPTNVAKRNGKFGYINLLSGKVMIPVEYDTLKVDSLMTDAEGKGIAIARKGNKLGVLSTDGEIVAPFEFDAIGDITLGEGAPAERDGKLVYLNFKNGVYAGTADVPPQYSSNFVPRPMASINPAPFDGLYVAESIPSMQAAWDAWMEGRLRWVAMPSIQINGKDAYVAFAQFSQSSLPFLPNVLEVKRQRDGFSLMIDVNDNPSAKVQPTALLRFSQRSDGLVCDNCADWNLPVHWRRQMAEKIPEFGGIGVAIQKSPPDAPRVLVLDILDKGPAQRAGLKAGDFIVRIDGESVAPDSADGVRDKLRGTAGTQVRLAVVRNGQALPEEIVVTRAVINLR